MTPELIHHFGTGCATVGAVLAWVYVYIYYHRSWRGKEAGRHQLLFAVGLAIILTWASYRALVVTGEVRNLQDEWVRLAVYLFCVCMFGWSLRLTKKYKVIKEEKK